MTRRPTFTILVLVALLAGCSGPGGGGDDAPPAARLGDAPWWKVGEFWVVDIERADGSTESFRLVNFWNDSESSHFWLGVADRAQAMDMALHDDMPFLGRIHWNILTPHERGVHAQGIYTFPVSVGEEFSGLAFDREWTITVRNGTQEGQLLFEGSAGDGATLEYDYLQKNDWFSFFEVQDRQGKREMRLDVKEHGFDAKGPHYFLRGRDYHLSENPGGAKEEPFEVAEEDVPHKSLAVELLGTASGPMTVTFVDAKGAVKHTETLTSGSVSKIVEIAGPLEPGVWTIRYAGVGTLTGTVEAVGILEYTRTL
jgi:hypothetical protein